MATITAAQAGNWSATATWTGGVVPGDGDTADLNGFVVDMDIATIPAAGALAAINSPAKAGQLTVNLTTLGNATINATTITCGTVTGFIYVTGNTNTLTINGNIVGGTGATPYGLWNIVATGFIVINGNVTGGGVTNSYGLYTTQAATITVNGIVTGGSGASSYGFRHSSTGVTNLVYAGNAVVGGSGTNAYGVFQTTVGTINITGNVVGGSASLAHGIVNNSTGVINITGTITGGSFANACGLQNMSTGVVTLNSCNLINSASAVAYSGYPPVWNLGATNYHQYAAGKLALEVAAANLLEGVGNGTVTGTYHEAAVAEVKDGIMFGPASAYEGTYDHYPIIGGHHIIQPARAA